MVKESRLMATAMSAGIVLAALAIPSPDVFADESRQPPSTWSRMEVDWRAAGERRVRAVHFPPGNQPPTRAPGTSFEALKHKRQSNRPEARTPIDRSSIKRKLVPPERVEQFLSRTEFDTLRGGARLKAHTAQMSGQPNGANTPSVLAAVIDSPPIDGFVPYIAVATTNRSEGDVLESTAVPTLSPSGSFTTATPQTDYAVGLLDTGAGASVMGNGAANRLNLFPSYNSGHLISLSGVSGTVDAYVSQPLGLYMTGLAEVDPNTLELTTSSMVGEWNYSLLLGQTPGPGQPDLPTAIGAPVAVYFASVFDNTIQHSITRDSQTYEAPDIQFYDILDPNVPEYDNYIPLELRPLGGANVQFIPCIDIFGSCGGDDRPDAPSIITGVSAQSLLFLGSVDLENDGEVALDRDRFMLDTGAQVTVVGLRVGARLRLDPNDPDFLVEILDVTGTLTFEPGFLIDRIELPALGEWLSLTNVPVVLLDVASPEGGTLDGIIGMNLMEQVNFVVRGGGLLGQPEPSLEYELIVPAVTDADFDNDGDVDSEDFGYLQRCLTDSETPQTNPGCQDALLDADSDVDEDDVALFELCVSGPAVPADPTCAP